MKISNLIAFIQENENQTAHNAFKEWDIMEDKLVTDEALLKDKLVTDEALLKEINHNIDSVKKSNPTLASIMLLEKRYLTKDINVIKSAIQKLKETSDQNLISDAAKVLLEQAKLFAGMEIEDTLGFVTRLNRIITKAVS